MPRRGPAVRRRSLDVDQLVLEQPFVGDGQPAGGHEAPRREGGEPELVGPALGLEPPVHHGEGALGVGARRRLGEREVDPQAVVRRRVHEAGGHPDDALVGPHLDVGGHLDAPPRPCAARVMPSTWSGHV